MGEPSSELAAKLSHISNVNEGETAPVQKGHGTNVYLEFTEFSRKEIKDLEKKFKEYCCEQSQKIGLNELKYMMEKLGAPQNHFTLKAMIGEVDEDKDEALVFREFLLIFRKLFAGEFAGRADDDGLSQLAKLVSIDVGEIGVGGAKNFFEGKIHLANRSNKFEEEIKQEQQEKKKELEEKKKRQEEFKNKQANFV